jgi:hypothetical protein
VGEGEEFYGHSDLVRIVLIDRDANNPSIITRINRLELFKANYEQREETKSKWILALVLLAITQLCLLIGGLVTIVINLKR